MHILITGGTGFIGSALVPRLLEAGHEVTVLSRHPDKAQKMFAGRVRAIPRLTGFAEDWPLDAVINLAGEGIADRPWTMARKQQLQASRVTLTEELVHVLRRRPQPPRVLISGSAIGWYGDQGERLLEENAAPHEEYMHTLCRDWENAARPVESMGVRLCLVRTGVVLGRSGGLLKRLLPIFGLGLGGRLGTGEQWLSWIALEDYLNVILLLLADEKLAGVFNATAPKPVSNAEFTATLAGALGRPAFLHIPATVLRLAMGEMSVLLLGGQRVLPSRLLEAKFRFRSRTLEECLRNELG
ncbi:MAG: TIGR01777 family oxidoreductase [Moraxellaceae bacterium]|nr:TIGR01777 family oxidoreductase [Moraxellaceae bacterium]